MNTVKTTTWLFGVLACWGCSAPATDLGGDGKQRLSEDTNGSGGTSSGTGGSSSSGGTSSDSGGSGGTSSGTGGSSSGGTSSGTGGSSSGTGGSSSVTTVTSSGTGGSAQSESMVLVSAYCEMEANCIAGCYCRGEETDCPCDGEQRRAECPGDVTRWYQNHAASSASCEQTLTAWLECITQVSCDDVSAFLRAHPDDVVPETPCSAEYHALTCDDWEPVTEYGIED